MASGASIIEIELILNLTPRITGLLLYKTPPPSIIQRANPIRERRAAWRDPERPRTKMDFYGFQLIHNGKIKRENMKVGSFLVLFYQNYCGELQQLGYLLILFMI